MGLASLVRPGRVALAGATYGPSDTDSLGPVVTASGTVNTKGAWTTLLDPTPDGGAYAIFIHGHNFSTTRYYLIDIGIAPTGTTNYQIVAPDLCFGIGTGAGQVWGDIVVPIYIPGGRRLGARSQSSTASGAFNMNIHLLQGDVYSGDALKRMTAYGVAASTSRGVTIDAGASTNTKPATWTQVVASTTNPIKLMMVGLTHQVTSTITRHFLIDVAVGAASSEQPLLTNLSAYYHASSDNIAPSLLGPFPVDVPPGKRLSARCQSSDAAAATRVTDIIIYGID